MKKSINIFLLFPYENEVLHWTGILSDILVIPKSEKDFSVHEVMNFFSNLVSDADIIVCDGLLFDSEFALIKKVIKDNKPYFKPIFIVASESDVFLETAKKQGVKHIVGKDIDVVITLKTVYEDFIKPHIDFLKGELSDKTGFND